MFCLSSRRARGGEGGVEYSWAESRPELAADCKCGLCGLGWMGQWTEWLAVQGGGRAACRLPSPHARSVVARV